MIACRPTRIFGVAAIVAVALSGASLPAEAVPGHYDNDVHMAKCVCTDCHATTPVEGDTLATAPLKAPTMQLCLSCHQNMVPARTR